MAKRRRSKPQLEDEAQKWINCIRPEVLERYQEISPRSIESYVSGWVHWCTRKRYLRPNGEQYNIASPWSREQARLWVEAGMPYEFSGGTEETEREHEKTDRARRRKKDKAEGKTRTRRRRKAA